MKALTIWQPWASLIIAGAKPYEFRKSRPPRNIIGERIVVHAGRLSVDRYKVERMLDQLHNHPDTAAEFCLQTTQAIPVLEAFLLGELPIGSGIGTAIVGESRFGSDIAAEFGVQRANDSDRDDHANWGWPMIDIEAWPSPVTMRGMQGLWPWPDASRFAEAL